MARTEGELTYCQGREQSILCGLFSAILHSVEIGGKGVWREMIAFKQYSLENATCGEEQISRWFMARGT